MIEKYFSLIVILVILIAFAIDYFWQKWFWNQGICAKSGKPWCFLSQIRSDNTYGDNHGNYITITYRSIDR